MIWSIVIAECLLYHVYLYSMICFTYFPIFLLSEVIHFEPYLENVPEMWTMWEKGKEIE